jgi:hypothetical protein
MPDFAGVLASTGSPNPGQRSLVLGAVAEQHQRGAVQRSARSAMISRNRSVPTAAPMSIEWTTSAKRTVTCLYSARVSPSLTGEPQP